MVNYTLFLEEVAQIAQKANRNPAEIEIIAVSKEVSLDKLQLLYSQGCRQFAENRLQEALSKLDHLPKDIHWHWIGPLQKNKVKHVVAHFPIIHSVDSFSLAEKIGKEGKDVKIFLEVNTSNEETKLGFSPEELKDGYKALQNLPNIQILGLMTMAPLTEDEKLIRDCFAKLRELRDELQEKTKPHHQMHCLSMGMSNDYPIAIQEGATHLRIGRKLFEKI